VFPAGNNLGKKPVSIKGDRKVVDCSAETSSDTPLIVLISEDDKALAGRMATKCEAYNALSVFSTLVFGSAIGIWKDDLVDEMMESTAAGRAVVMLGALVTMFSMIATVLIVMDNYFCSTTIGKEMLSR
jgi:hypothetical protein